MDKHDKKHRQDHRIKTASPMFATNGSITGMLDVNNQPIRSGDIVELAGTKNGLWNRPRVGRIFLANDDKKYASFMYNLAFAPYDELNPESYGKERSIPLDNGAKAMLRKLADYASSVEDIGMKYS